MCVKIYYFGTDSHSEQAGRHPRKKSSARVSKAGLHLLAYSHQCCNERNTATYIKRKVHRY
jgi:hypothetical protein